MTTPPPDNRHEHDRTNDPADAQTLRDRLTDIYLADVVGGVEPPDLSQQIVAALKADRSTASGQTGRPVRSQPRRSPRMTHQLNAPDRAPFARTVMLVAATLFVVAAIALVMWNRPDDTPAQPDNPYAGAPPFDDPNRDDAAVRAAFPGDWRELLENADLELLDTRQMVAGEPSIVDSLSALKVGRELAIVDPQQRRDVISAIYRCVANYDDAQKTRPYLDALMRQAGAQTALKSLYTFALDKIRLQRGVRAGFDLKHRVMTGFRLDSDPRYSRYDEAVADVCRAVIAMCGFVEPEQWDADADCPVFFVSPTDLELLPGAFREWLGQTLTDREFEGFKRDKDDADRIAAFRRLREWTKNFLATFEDNLAARLQEASGALAPTALANAAVIRGIRATDGITGRTMELLVYNRALIVRVGDRVTTAGVWDDLLPLVGQMLGGPAMERFDFNSGGINHPEGDGEWHVRFKPAERSLGFSLWHGEKVLQYDTVTLPGPDATRLQQLIDAAAFAQRESTSFPATPGSVQMEFTLVTSAGVHNVRLWESEAAYDDNIRALLQQFKALIKTHTKRDPVFRTEK